MKRLVAIMLSLLFMVSVFAACQDNKPSSQASGVETPAKSETSDGSALEISGSADSSGMSVNDLLNQKYEEPVTIKVVLGYREPESPDAPEDLTPETTTAVKQFKELYNINLEYSWIVNADQFSSKFGAELAAGNLPDIMYVSPNMFEDLYQQGAFQDITDVYEQYTNDDIDAIVNFDGELINAGKRDGKLYGLPMATHPAQVTSQTYYRMDILKQYGVETYDDLPSTIADFETLCDKILAENGGNPIIPANKYFFDSGLSDFTPIFHAYESWVNDSAWVDYGDGKLEYPGIHPNVKNAVSKLNEWYEKGYFPKDFAAMDVWGANTPAVNDIVDGKYPIVFGSWWIPNWPLNMNVANEPGADWVVGPTLTLDDSLPKIQVPRYPVNNFVAISRNCQNPEAVFKMMNWSINYDRKTSTYEFEQNATEEEKLEMNSHSYIWLPYRTYSPSTPIENFQFFNDLEKKSIFNIDDIDTTDAPSNNEFITALKTYVKYHENDKNKTDPTIWGFYTSRLAENGGVAKMYELYTNADIQYDEVYITTPTMITKQSQLKEYKNNTLISMIMGEIPIEDFDKYIEEWNNLGGNEIRAEVNEWYETQK